jgi:hypothetical protein
MDRARSDLAWILIATLMGTIGCESVRDRPAVPAPRDAGVRTADRDAGVDVRDGGFSDATVRDAGAAPDTGVDADAGAADDAGAPAWTIETIRLSGFDGWPLTLVSTDDEVVHLACLARPFGGAIEPHARHVTRDGTTWAVRAASIDSRAGWFPAFLAVDGAGALHAALTGERDLGPYVATFDGARWDSGRLDTGTTDVVAGLVAAADGRLVLVRNDLRFDLLVESAAWGREGVVTLAEPPAEVAMVLDASDRVHVAYHDVARDAVYLTTRSTSGWAAPVPLGVTGPEVAAAAAGTDVVVASAAADPPRVRLDRAGTVTEIPTKDTPRDVAIAIDRQGRTHVVWVQASGVRHAVSTADGGWSITDIDEGGARDPAITIDRSGAPVVCWTEVTAIRRLRCATGRGS